MRFTSLKLRFRLFFFPMAICASLMTSTAVGQGVIHVTKAGSPAPTGELSAPFQLVEAGIVKTLTTSATSVQIETGDYYETFTTDVPCTLTASGGPATIGTSNYQAATTLDITTLNTHLFGDVVGPSWMDYERADDIADFFGDPNPWPDVVGFQEIWDEDLFFGGDGANGILPRSGYPYGDHGDDTFGNPVNSGLALMSDFPLNNFVQVEWDEDSGIPEGLSAKGWIQATIEKDGFSIGVFTLHTNAGFCVGCIVARIYQLEQLRDGINAYRVAHPDHAVFAFGDYNVYGDESVEYWDTLIDRIGNQAGGRDADRNAPGFVSGNFDTWTLCDCNPLAMYFDDDTVSGRLDYIFYFPSFDGTVEVVPLSADVVQFTGRMLSDDGLTTDQSSDHWSLHGHFRLVRP